ncbi:unnamed protein product [Pleuronectes platessa]|uniref:Uncharacterized protein n=1 Tax=Pleuronectes platessa TaxID=8262 RepID=A0A9N7VBE6_PLEPL|nr:unnamed protein product [Pleuronectes platessa]
MDLRQLHCAVQSAPSMATAPPSLGPTPREPCTSPLSPLTVFMTVGPLSVWCVENRSSLRSREHERRELTTGDKHIPLQPGRLPLPPPLAGGSAGELAARSIVATKRADQMRSQGYPGFANSHGKGGVLRAEGGGR